MNADLSFWFCCNESQLLAKLLVKVCFLNTVWLVQKTWIFSILLNVCIISNPHELNHTVSLTLCFPLVAVIKKVEVTKKSENQSRSPSRKSGLKATVRHPRATQHHICAKRKPTGDHTITGRLLAMWLANTLACHVKDGVCVCDLQVVVFLCWQNDLFLFIFLFVVLFIGVLFFWVKLYTIFKFCALSALS